MTSSNDICVRQGVRYWEFRQEEETGGGHMGLVTENYCSGGLREVAASITVARLGRSEWPKGTFGQCYGGEKWCGIVDVSGQLGSVSWHSPPLGVLRAGLYGMSWTIHHLFPQVVRGS